MTPADHFHRQLPTSQDRSNLQFNLDNYDSTGDFISNSVINHHNNNLIHSKSHMGGQNPVFFAPSSFIVAGHKQNQELHEAMLASKQPLTSRGPLQLVNFKDVVGGGRGGGGGGDGDGGGNAIADQIRMGARSQLNFGTGSLEYDAGAGSAGSVGEDMSMDYMEGGEYLDHMEGGVGELMKKGSRRLGFDQVKALEKAFEAENRLDPERKVRLAAQLGLQPRQVAVWFQNRRARWKTKQMERDFAVLKSKFEALKADRDKLLQEKDLLQAEVARLKGHAVKEAGPTKSQHGTKGPEQDSSTLASCSLVLDDARAPPLEANKKTSCRSKNDLVEEEEEEEAEEEEEEVEEASPKVMHEQKLLQNDSLSSTEDSENGAIVDSASMKAFEAEEPDFCAQHWRLPPAPPLYKPTTIKNEEWQEHGEHINSFSMPLDTNWYNWS